MSAGSAIGAGNPPPPPSATSAPGGPKKKFVFKIPKLPTAKPQHDELPQLPIAVPLVSVLQPAPRPQFRQPTTASTTVRSQFQQANPAQVRPQFHQQVRCPAPAYLPRPALISSVASDPPRSTDTSNVVGLGFDDDFDDDFDDCQILDITSNLEKAQLQKDGLSSTSAGVKPYFQGPDRATPATLGPSRLPTGLMAEKTVDLVENGEELNDDKATTSFDTGECESRPVGNKMDNLVTNDEDEGNFHEYARNDPWYQTFAIEELIPLMYRNIANSDLISASKRIGGALSCLEYVEGLRKSDWHLNSDGNPSLIATEIKHVLDVFELIFQRILRLKLDDHDKTELERLIEAIWKCHVNGTINFTGTNVLKLLLNRSSKHLDEALLSLMKLVLFPGNETNAKADEAMPNPTEITKSAEFSVILRFCKTDVANFQYVFKQVFSIWLSTKCHPKILYFTQQFIESMKKESSHLNRKLMEDVTMYPAIFHPVLYFTSSIEEFGLEGPINICVENILANNTHIQLELLRLINELYEIIPPSDEEQRDLIFFFLSSNALLANFVSDCFESNVLTFKDFPLLWAQLFYSKNK